MKYFIFANNKDLEKYNPTNLLNFIYPEDIIITLNHGLPHSTIFKNAPNIQIDRLNKQSMYHFSRRSFNRKVPYSGIKVIDPLKSKFKKIFLYPHPESIGDINTRAKITNFISEETSFSIEEISHMSGFSSGHHSKRARKFLSSKYNKTTNLSMGLIAYLYIHQIKNATDNIILVGFTHEMNKNKHNANGEKDFFNKECEDNLCRMISLKL
jgi:hypothetical protein